MTAAPVSESHAAEPDGWPVPGFVKVVEVYDGPNERERDTWINIANVVAFRAYYPWRPIDVRPRWTEVVSGGCDRTIRVNVAPETFAKMVGRRLSVR